MEKYFVIGEDAYKKIESGLLTGRNWIVANIMTSYQDGESIDHFPSKHDAISFAGLMESEEHEFKVFYAASMADVFRQLPYNDQQMLETSSNEFQAQKINSQQNSTSMDLKAMNFNETQLKRSGFADAFTPELQKQMKDGIPFIQHPFTKNFENDRVDGILYLKKSADSNYYFLNKFDLHLQKEGGADAVGQTFYVNFKKQAAGDENDQQKVRHENRYTLKEAYNLLAERPVYKHLVNKEGGEYDAWVKLNFKNKLDNGNYEMKQYTQNYGFNLEEILSKYQIKELLNEQYKQSLLDSLHRGNLQKVTFLGQEGKEEKLFISPNITFGILNVYDQNKQYQSLEKLVEKKFVAEDFYKQVIGRQKQDQKIQNTNENETGLGQNLNSHIIGGESLRKVAVMDNQAVKTDQENKLDAQKLSQTPASDSGRSAELKGGKISEEKKPVQNLQQKNDKPVQRQTRKQKLG